MREGFEPLPPHSDNSEQCVLGSLLIDPEAMSAVRDTINADDFYHPRNRDAYRAMASLYERGSAIDFTTVCDEMERLGADARSSVAYLTELLQVTPSSVNVESYAEIVRRTSTMRRLIRAAGTIAGIAYEDGDDVDSVLDQAMALISGIGGRRRTDTLLHIGGIMHEYLDGINLGDAPGLSGRISTDFIDLDAILGGLQRSDLIILAARPSLGKTSLALNIARNASVIGNHTVALFSAEMSRAQIAARLLSSEAKIPSERLRTGHLGQDEIANLSGALALLSQAPLYCDDTPGISMREIRSRATMFHVEHPIDLLIVDYLQLLHGRGGVNRVEEMTEITQGLKNLARELGCPVLALSQLNRSVEQRTPHIPVLSDLRDSGSIEQDADVVLFIYREDVYDRDTERKGIADIYIAKHRNGPTGRISMLWQDRYAQFANLGHAPVGAGGGVYEEAGMVWHGA